jgi:hypothetical protein
MYHTNTTKLLIAAIAAASMTSCLKSRDYKTSTGSKGGASSLSSVTMKLPANDAFKPSSGNAKVNAYQLVINPTDSDCADATVIDETKSYGTKSLDYKLARGCDYELTFAIGEQSSGATKNFTAYYKTKEPLQIKKSSLDDDSVSVSPRLLLTEEGKAKNLPAKPSTSPDDSDDDSGDDTPDEPKDTEPKDPEPDSGKPALAAKLKVSLEAGSGQKVKFEDYFTTEYMIVDFSQVGCGPCVSHASEINRSSSFQKMTSGSGKCKSMILVSGDQTDSWKGVVGASTFSGKSSFGYSGGLNGFSQLFGIPRITSTPTVIVVDRQGKVVSNNARSESDVARICQ